MTAKLTKNIILTRLAQRNSKLPESKNVRLFPKNQPYVNQSAPLQFKCNNNHIWIGTAGRVIFAERGCPECKIEQDHINKRTPFNQLLAEAHNIHNNKYTYDESTYSSKMKKMTIICSEHGNFEQSMFRHIEKKIGCPICNKNIIKATRLQQFITEATKLHDSKYDYSSVDYVNRHVSINISCKKHGVFKQRPGDHLNGHGCPKCVNSRISNKQITWMEHISSQKNIYIQHALNDGEFSIPSTKYKADGYCAKTNTVYEFHGDAFHGNLQRYAPDYKCHPFKPQFTALELYTTTKKKEQQILDLGYKLVVMWESDFDKLNIPIKRYDYDNIVHSQHIEPIDEIKTFGIKLTDDKFKGYKYKHNYECLMCGNHFTSTLTQRKQTYIKRGVIGCPKCNRKSNTSVITKKLLNSLQKYSSTVTNNENTIFIDNHIIKIIDIAKPNTRDSMTSPQPNTIYIFSDEIVNNFDLVKKKLQHYMQNNTIGRIHGRKCTIKKISTTDKQEFLNAYHIQGNDLSKTRYGAYHNNELVAVMTFTKPRVALGYKNTDRSIYDGTWELSRFATSDQYRIPGIASKMLKHFEREHTPKKVISYADRRWSTGNMYHQLNFNLEVTNPPSYHYIINGKRKHRWNYRKDKLKTTLPNYNSTNTEYKNMQDAGYWRVWDCGTYRFVKTYKK